MKKYCVLTSLFAAATFSLVTTTAAAYPVDNSAVFTCPDISVVSSFGNSIAGFGTEVILSQNNPVYFQTNQFPTGVPATLGNYSNLGTDYDSTLGIVSCDYTSSNSTEQPFSLIYSITNGLGGLIQSQSANVISLTFPVGFHF